MASDHHLQSSLSPLPIGRFWLYYNQPLAVAPPEGVIPLFISDASAFGSGHHITTAHCLQFLGRISGFQPRRVADLGCGSGILSLAVASLWKCHQVAADIEPKAVVATRDNLRANGIHHVQTAVSNGFSHPLVCRSGPYDLILANIGTPVVTALVSDIDSHLAPNGIALLSGVDASQYDQVLSVYEQRGFKLLQREDEHGCWSTMAVTR
jgi:ribosomal protein L11 methyltransferase